MRGCTSQDWLYPRSDVGKRRDLSGWAPDMEYSLAHSASGSPSGSCLPQMKAPFRPFPLVSSEEFLGLRLEAGPR